MADEREIEEERRTGESSVSEWLLARPNRFSRARAGSDVLALGVLSCLCLMPVGWLAVVRAIRCGDQYGAAGLPTPKAAIAGAVLGGLGTVLQIALIWHLTVGR